jgi:hypothetical protein
MRRLKWKYLILLLVLLAPLAWQPSALQSQAPTPFRVEEVTIAGLHAAIQSGQTTCRQVVQAYIDRAKAYNGVCTALVTPDGAPVAPRGTSAPEPHWHIPSRR